MSVSVAAVPRERLGEDPGLTSVVELLAQAAGAAPGKEFLRFVEGSWTFREVDDWSSRLARHLVDMGIRPGDRVAIMMSNIVQWPLSWLGILKAGGVAVPVNHSYQASDLEFVLRDSGASLVLTTIDHTDVIASTGLTDLTVLDVLALDLTDRLAVLPDVLIAPDTLANLQYTSGTTGFPKACMLPQEYWVRTGWIACGVAELTYDDVVLTSAPFSYIDAMWNTVMCLFARATLVVLPRFSASGFFADVRRHGVTFFYVLGTMPALLFKQPPSPDDLDNHVRLVLCSAIPPALHSALEERWGAPWREIYGMTETGVDLISFHEETGLVGSGFIGRVTPSKTIRVVDENGEDVPDGSPGELLVSGSPLMVGYWNRPEVTAEVSREGWFHTGDLVERNAEGHVRVVGRLKDMVRRGGENISSAEVEDVLTRYSEVSASAVIAEPDELFGEEIKAFVRLAPGVDPSVETAARIVAHAATRLARFKVPRYVEFVDDFPMTPSERIAKADLKKRSVSAPGITFDLQRNSATSTLNGSTDATADRK